MESKIEVMSFKVLLLPQIIFLCCVMAIFYFIYSCGYACGKDDCLIVIENEITAIRERVKRNGYSTYEESCVHKALCDLHKEVIK